ncbi:MAG: hypothetical protein ACK4NA_10445 [Alphaproteobacteria bacterium]
MARAALPAVVGLALLAAPMAACGPVRVESGDRPASPPLCELAGARSYAAFADMPPQVVADLLSRFSDVPTVDSAARPERGLAPRDGAYDSAASLSTPQMPSRRFVQGLARGDDAVVIYEHGDGPHIHVVLYRKNAAGDYHALANATTASRVHCETVQRVMANPRDPALWFSRIDW